MLLWACRESARRIHADERHRAGSHVRHLSVPFLDRAQLRFHPAQLDQLRRDRLALHLQGFGLGLGIELLRFGFGARLRDALFGFDLDALQIALGLELLLFCHGLGFDRVRARSELEAAGWRDRDGDGVRESVDGTELSITLKYNDNLTRQQIAEIMQSQLAEIGVRVQPQVVEYATLVEQIMTPSLRDFDAVMMGWVVDFKLDDTDLFHSTRRDTPNQWSGLQSPEMDRLLEAISNTVDREEAMPLWREYQNVLIQEQPYTFFYFPDRLMGVNRRVRNATMDARGEWLSVKDWYLDPASR